MKYQRRWFLEVITFLAILWLVMFCAGKARGEDQLSFNFGYDIWGNSGRTFVHSDVHDKQFNRPFLGLEYVKWGDSWGGYASLGRDLLIRECIFPNWIFDGEMIHASVGLKYRWKFKNPWELYYGGGFKLLYSDFKYGDGQSETHFTPGVETEVGIIYHLSKAKFIGFDLQYSFNKFKSNVYYDTWWTPGGLRPEFLIGVRW